MNATITPLNENDLRVERDGHQWRRIAGRWQMLSAQDEWFDCEIQYPNTRNQVEDYENCLRSYTFNQGPDYPRGRKPGEDVGEFIQRLQVQEARKDSKNIFASVPLTYTVPRPRLAPMAKRSDRYIIQAYEAAMTAKAERLSAYTNGIPVYK